MHGCNNRSLGLILHMSHIGRCIKYGYITIFRMHIHYTYNIGICISRRSKKKTIHTLTLSFISKISPVIYLQRLTPN